jgi:hypothetical protein
VANLLSQTSQARDITIGCVDALRLGATPEGRHVALVDIGGMTIAFSSYRPPCFEVGDRVLVGRVRSDSHRALEDWNGHYRDQSFVLCTADDAALATSNPSGVVRLNAQAETGQRFSHATHDACLANGRPMQVWGVFPE